MSKYLYILNNGHGSDTYIEGLNPYRRSEVWKDKSQLFEYEFNRNVVKYLSYMLKVDNIDYFIVVPELNDISLQERCKRANEQKNNSLYISIHSNWFEKPNTKGFETHYHSIKGKKFAQIFQDQLKVLGTNRGLKKSTYYELIHTNMPAILTENGFYSNEKECKKLMTPEFQYQIAKAHFKAIQIIEYTNQELFN